MKIFILNAHEYLIRVDNILISKFNENTILRTLYLLFVLFTYRALSFITIGSALYKNLFRALHKLFESRVFISQARFTLALDSEINAFMYFKLTNDNGLIDLGEFYYSLVIGDYTYLTNQYIYKNKFFSKKIKKLLVNVNKQKTLGELGFLITAPGKVESNSIRHTKFDFLAYIYSPNIVLSANSANPVFIFCNYERSYSNDFIDFRKKNDSCIYIIKSSSSDGPLTDLVNGWDGPSLITGLPHFGAITIFSLIEYCLLNSKEPNISVQGMNFFLDKNIYAHSQDSLTYKKRLASLSAHSLFLSFGLVRYFASLSYITISGFDLESFSVKDYAFRLESTYN